jgi:hypothetical protein
MNKAALPQDLEQPLWLPIPPFNDLLLFIFEVKAMFLCLLLQVYFSILVPVRGSDLEFHPEHRKCLFFGDHLASRSVALSGFSLFIREIPWSSFFLSWKIKVEALGVAILVPVWMQSQTHITITQLAWPHVRLLASPAKAHHVDIEAILSLLGVAGAIVHVELQVVVGGESMQDVNDIFCLVGDLCIVPIPFSIFPMVKSKTECVLDILPT